MYPNRPHSTLQGTLKGSPRWHSIQQSTIMKTTTVAHRVLAFAVCLLLATSMSACDSDSESDSPEGTRRSLPNSLASVTDLNFETPSGVFPLYRGQDMNGGDVFYIVTESNEIDESIRLGLNWTPKLVHVLGTRAVQTATLVSATGGSAVEVALAGEAGQAAQQCEREDLGRGERGVRSGPARKVLGVEEVAGEDVECSQEGVREGHRSWVGGSIPPTTARGAPSPVCGPAISHQA